MNYQFQGKIYFAPNDFKNVYATMEHPLKFIDKKLVGWDDHAFGEYYYYNQMTCTFNGGMLDGPIEVFNDAGYLIISGNFAEGFASGNWEIFHHNEYQDISFKSKWQKGKLISQDIFFSAAELYDQCGQSLEMSCSLYGETLEISHDIWGYWSNYADPLPTFRATYKLQGKHILQRIITQYPLWGEKETEIAIETFNKNGSLERVKLHDLIKKHNAYIKPLQFKPWVGYDDDNEAEVLMVRTINLLEAREVENIYEDDFNGVYDNIFGYYFKLNQVSKTYKEMCYFAWGKKYGVSMHFSEDNKIHTLKWEGKKVIWDNVSGINKNNLERKIKRKYIQPTLF